MIASHQRNLPPLTPYEKPLSRKHIAVPKAVKQIQAAKQKADAFDGVASDADSAPIRRRKRGPRYRRPIRAADLTALYTMVNPSPEFRSKIGLDTMHIDLRWLAKDPVEPPPEEEMLTLANMRDDLRARQILTSHDSLDTKRAVLLNSPRSVITVLRNGLTVESLQKRTLEQYKQQGELEGRIPAVIQKRYENLERKREQLLADLVEEYEGHVQQLPMDVIVNFFTTYDPLDPNAGSFLPPEAAWPASEIASQTSHTMGSQTLHSTASPGYTESAPDTTTSPKVVRQSPPRAHLVPQSQRPLAPSPTAPTPIPDLPSADSPGAAEQSEDRGVRQSWVEGLDPAHLVISVDPADSPSSQRHAASTKRSPARSASPTLGGGSASNSWMAWSTKKIEDSRARVHKLVESDLAVEKRKQDMATSIARVLEFERGQKERKAAMAQMYRDRALAMQQSIDRHQQLAQQKLHEMEEKKAAEQARKEAAKAQREETVARLVAQKQDLAAKNKERRLEKLLAVQQAQAQAEEQRIINFEAEQKQRRQKLAKHEAIKQARQIDLKYKSLEAEQKRMMTHQRSALLDLQWRLDIEDRSERAQERVDKFMAQRDKDMALGRSGDAEREGKRQRVYNQAKQLLASRTSHLMDKREAFEKRHAEMQAQREFEAHMREEDHRLKTHEKLEFKHRCQNQMEYEKLYLIDQIHSKAERTDMASECKQVVMARIKFEYEEKKRERDQIIDDMKQQQVINDKKTTACLYLPDSPKNSPPRDRPPQVPHKGPEPCEELKGGASIKMQPQP